ncbi:MAG: PAS-domain containing protein [Pseudomonadota bacterium]
MTVLASVFLYTLGAFLVLILGLQSRASARASSALDFSDTALGFLIQDRRIIDANFSGKRILNRSDRAISDFDQLRLFLTRNFDDADRLLDCDCEGGDVMAHSRDGQMQAIKHVARESVRLTVHYIDGDVPATGDIHTLRAVEAELQTLRANTAAAPFLLWRQNHTGEIVWVNQAYLNAAQKLAGVEETTWPLPTIFPSLRNQTAPMATETRRIAAPRKQGEPDAWYDCHISSVGNDVLFTAVPADEAVRAENRRREFTQTLTKTFAELAIGLAIFDRSRRLVLFNPALLDLTNLPTDFLTSRPSLIGFLDQLRENRVMPEPRDYRSWRTSIAELEAAAVDGTYSETWSLPDGQTYHVTGRPHPDGAVALLFEDISAEMSLTRHFRSELEQFQAVIDVIDDAVAVFTPAGEVAIMNQAYRDLWQINDDDFMVGDLAEATRRWHDMTAPTPVWGDFRDFAQTDQEREEWCANVALRDGRQLACRFKPRRGGATMAIFHVEKVESGAKLQTAV